MKESGYKLSKRDSKRVKELYELLPHLSAKTIAKQLGINFRQTLDYMKTLGYTNESHVEAVKNHMLPKRKYVRKPPEVRKAERLEKAKPKPKPIVEHFGKYQSPETLDALKQKRLDIEAERLLNEVMLASEEGRVADFIRLRKEYEIAERKAQAFKERGRLSEEDKDIYGRESVSLMK